MSPSDYGIVNLVTTFSASIALLSLGFPVAQQVNYHRLKGSQSELGSYLFTIIITSTIALGSVSILLLAMPWSKSLIQILFGTEQIEMFPHVFLGIGIGICGAFNTFTVGYFNIRREFHIQSLLSLIGFVVTASLSWILLSQTTLGATARLMGMFIGAMLPILIGMIPYLRSMHPAFKIEHLRDAWRIGWPAALNWGIFLIINQSDRIILAHFLTLEIVGFYTLAFTLASGMAVVVQSVAQSYTPLFMETATSQSGDVRDLEKITTICVQIVLAIGLIASAWLPDLVRVLLPPNYSRTIIFLPSLVGSLGMYIIFNLLSLNYNFHKKTIYMPAFTIFAAGLSAGLNLTFIPIFGEQAAAINSIITYTLLTILALLISRRIFPQMQFAVLKTMAMIGGYVILVLIHQTCINHKLLHWAAVLATTVFVATSSIYLIRGLKSLKSAGMI